MFWRKTLQRRLSSSKSRPTLILKCDQPRCLRSSHLWPATLRLSNRASRLKLYSWDNLDQQLIHTRTLGRFMTSQNLKELARVRAHLTSIESRHWHHCSRAHITNQFPHRFDLHAAPKIPHCIHHCGGPPDEHPFLRPTQRNWLSPVNLR